MDLITCFFSCLLFLTTLEALKVIVLPAPSYNLHQQLFVKKLTDCPQDIGQKNYSSFSLQNHPVNQTLELGE